MTTDPNPTTARKSSHRIDVSELCPFNHAVRCLPGCEDCEDGKRFCQRLADLSDPRVAWGWTKETNIDV